MTKSELDHAIAQLVSEHPTTVADWGDVLRRAGEDFALVSDGARRRVRAGGSRRWTSRRRVIGLAVGLVLAVGGATTALGVYYGGHSPGFSAGLSAFDRLPVADLPPSIPGEGLDRAGARVGLEPGEAARRLRRLRVGLQHGDLYAFRGEGGSVCVWLATRLATCVNDPAPSNVRSVFPIYSPGYPNEDPAVVAIVADNATRVHVVAGGERRAVDIVNNSIYANIDRNSSESVALEVEFVDGTARTVVVK